MSLPMYKPHCNPLKQLQRTKAVRLPINAKLWKEHHVFFFLKHIGELIFVLKGEKERTLTTQPPES
jgi:hypothetical protein